MSDTATRLKWEIRELTPSDGSRADNILVDHRAELRRDDGTWMMIQFGSYNVPEHEARLIVKDLVSGLNRE